MNQEQNNFNSQGNNEMPNIQQLNNQNFNNTFNQNVQQSENVNQTAYNSQQQSTPNYQQPINQMNMQQPTPQPVNTFDTGSANNQSFNNKPPKKNNFGLIMGIVVAVVVVIVGILLGSKLLSNGDSNDSLDNENANNVTDNSGNTSGNKEPTEYEAEWNDFVVYIHGVEFNFPMSFQEFETKIASTKYKLSRESDREKSIYSSIMDRNQVTYIYQVREYTLGQNGLAYNLYVHLQNLEEESQPAYNTMVIGIETETISPYVDIDERGYDDNLYFTKKKLHIGQDMTKEKLEKFFGRGNSWVDDTDIYGAGNYSAGLYKFSKFQCSMRKNRISKLIMKNYIDEEE